MARRRRRETTAFCLFINIISEKDHLHLMNRALFALAMGLRRNYVHKGPHVRRRRKKHVPTARRPPSIIFPPTPNSIFRRTLGKNDFCKIAHKKWRLRFLNVEERPCVSVLFFSRRLRTLKIVIIKAFSHRKKN